MGCKVFQIGVFFDGTGNSREKKTTYSNVAKLYEAYKILNDELSGFDKSNAIIFAK